mmetsp:Transcript_43502/g.50951  ORF Transcript_43502/g.50951 Transcript_43502/m.50951 type:complete len:93 (-) Transcript_43502:606-884(-)
MCRYSFLELVDWLIGFVLCPRRSPLPLLLIPHPAIYSFHNGTNPKKDCMGSKIVCVCVCSNNNIVHHDYPNRRNRMNECAHHYEDVSAPNVL